jgi:PPOX class probable F420-dependent enzyme
MDTDAARDFVRSHHRAVIATRTRDRVQQSPVLVAVDADGRFVVSTPATTYKAKHLRADPWVQLCVMNDYFFGEWIYIEGEAEVVSLPEAMEPLVEYYRSISGEHGDWDDYRAAMEREQRVAVRITPHRVGPDRG